jgi:hypothetical protein
MIDKIFEPYYDILLSIFLGIFIILSMHNLYDIPRIVIKTDTNIDIKKNKICCKNLSLSK